MYGEISTSKEIHSQSNQTKQESNFQRTVNFIRALAIQSMDTRKNIIDSIQAIAQYFCSPYLTIKLDLDGRPFEHAIHFGDIPTETWKHLCSLPMLECISTQKSQVNFYAEKNAGTRMAILTVPVQSRDHGPIGIASVIIQTGDATAAKQHLTELENLLQAIILSNHRDIGACSTETTAVDMTASRTGGAVPATSFLLDFCRVKYFENPTALAYQLVHGLRGELQCVDVSFGIVEKNQVRLLAISGHDSLYRRSPGCVTIEQAMTESLDCGENILVQSDGPSSPIGSKLNCGIHNKWRAASGNCCCLSVPIKKDDEILAVCSLRRDESQPFTAAELSYLERFQADLAVQVHVARSISKTLWNHLKDHTDRTIQRYVGSTVRKVVVLSTFIAFVTFLVLPWPHSLSVPCKLVSASPKIYTAPFAGQIKKVHFRNGDLVKAGAVLFEMDTEELQLRKSKLEAELMSRKQAMIRFLQNDETAKAGEEKSNIEVLQNELFINETKLSQASVRSLEDGTVFDSDLIKREGETVAMGEQLLNFAPVSTQQVELHVPDYLGMEIKKGQQGHFVTSAEPDLWHAIELERVETASTSQDGENIIKVIAKSDDLGTESKLGLSGFAQVSIGKQAGWWILLQKPIRYVQRKVWQL